MAEQQKTVFISYRRNTSKILSLLIFRELTERGFDVFRDVERIGAGVFERIIMSQIASRAHFVLLLTPGTLERCHEPGDWLRREIERALELERNIIPVLVDSFTLEEAEPFLVGALSQLKRFNAMTLYTEYLDPALDRLCDTYFLIEEYGSLQPSPEDIEADVREIIEETQDEPAPTPDDLKSEKLFVQALIAQDNDQLTEAVMLYDEAIALNPAYTKAYYNRALTRYQLNHIVEALTDYSQAIELDPQYIRPYVNRGVLYSRQGEHDRAVEDYSAALKLDDTYAVAYLNRGNAYMAMGMRNAALQDFRRFLDLGGHESYPNVEHIERVIRALEQVRDTISFDQLTNIVAGELQEKPDIAPPDAERDAAKNHSSGDEPDTATNRFALRKLFGKVRQLSDDPQRASATESDELREDKLGDAAELQYVEDERTEDMIADVDAALPFVFDSTTRPLQYDTLPPLASSVFRFGVASDVGMVRNNNQDAVSVFGGVEMSIHERPSFGIFVVADGMGGHNAGEQASAIAVQTVTASVMKDIFIPMHKDDDEQPDVLERRPVSEVLMQAFQQANKAVQDAVEDGGTTMTAVVIIGDLAYVAHVGDTRCYLVTPDVEAEQITRDHSLVQRLIEMNQVTPEEANTHPQRSVLYRALGQSDMLEVDVFTRRLAPGSILVMCSDGLWNLIAAEEFTELLQRMPDLQEACDVLVALANTRGGTDNISVILISMPY